MDSVLNIGNIAIAQIVSAVVIVLSSIFLIVIYKRKGKT